MNKLNNIDQIEIEITEKQLPTKIDLNILFGCMNLKYRVAVEYFGVVEVALSQTSGILELSRFPDACAGTSTRVAVRAYDADGDSVCVVFSVQLGSEAVLIQQMA